MKYTTKFNRVESVTYEFDEYDIRLALMNHFKIKHPPGQEIEFGMWDSVCDEVGDFVSGGGAEIIIRFTKEIQADE